LDKLESETNATWIRVMAPLELLYDSYERVTGTFELLAAVNQTLEMDAAAGQGKELLNGFGRRLQQSTALYALLLRLRQPWTTWVRHSFSQLRALDYWLAKMRKAGVHLASCPAQMADFNRLSDEEANLKRQYAGNVAQGTAAFHMTLRNGAHLQGVPRSTLAAMAAAAQERNLTYGRGWTWAITPASTVPPRDGAPPTPEWGPWTVTFDPWVYNSMMAYCPDRRIRQILYQSYENRASQAPLDNVPVVERML
ncbi:hypothetical protein H632_c4145p0, partial [Helicosporidium sp. ATCC 50920]